MVGSGEVRRKTRIDKKRDISPTVTIELRECLRRLSFITDTPIKDVAEAVCMDGLKRPKVMEHMSQYFRRAVRVGTTLYVARTHGPSVGRRHIDGKSVRVSIRFKSDDHALIAALAYAMDCTVSRACAVLLDASIRDGDFINEFVQRYLSEHVDDERMRELRKLLRYVNANNPYGEEYSWANLLSLMVDEVREATGKVTDKVGDFVVRHWRDNK